MCNALIEEHVYHFIICHCAKPSMCSVQPVISDNLLDLQVRDFQAVIGKEVRQQCLEKMGGKPDILLACVGGGSNAIGLFHEFVDDEDVRLIGTWKTRSGCRTAMSNRICTNIFNDKRCWYWPSSMCHFQQGLHQARNFP